MKSKHLFILGAIFLVLIVGVIAKMNQQPPELANEEFASLNLEFDELLVSKIEMFKADHHDKGTAIVRDEEGWVVQSLQNARGDKDKIEGFFKTIRNAKGEIRGVNEFLFSDFGIVDNEGFHVKLSDAKDNTLLHFLVGTKTIQQGRLFIRRNGSENTFLTDTNFLLAMGIFKMSEENITRAYFVSTQMLYFDKNDVTSLEVKQWANGKEFVTASVVLETDPFDAAKTAWKFKRDDLPFQIGDDKVTQFLDSLKTWRAQEAFPPEDKNYDFSDPILQITAGLKDGSDIVLKGLAQDAESQSYPIYISNQPVFYHMFMYYFENMQAQDHRFFGDNPFGITENNISKFVIHRDKEEPLTVDPKDERWKGFSVFLNDIKNFRAKELTFDDQVMKKVKSPEKNFLEIFVAGKDVQIMDVGEPVNDRKRDYVALIRGNKTPFLINGSTYRNIFENIERIETEPPKEDKMGP
jgi:hypothetical protein